MTDRRMITDRFLRSLRPAPRGQRIEVFDTRVPGFGIRWRMALLVCQIQMFQTPL